MPSPASSPRSSSHVRGLRLFWAASIVLGFASGVGCASTTGTIDANDGAKDFVPRAPFESVKASHTTTLKKRAPITDKWPTFETPDGAERVTYPSTDGLELWGLFGAPTANNTGEPAPALVYLHGHFFMTPKDLSRLAALRAQGFAVLTATLRGRNGNNGAHEMLYGEVDDAAAAVAYLASRPDIDAKRVYAFGHSMGGGTAALLSLMPLVPVRITGSCGAIYSTDTWRNWAKGRDHNLIRFDANDALEGELRVLHPWADQLAHPHIALMGTAERTTLRNAKRVKAQAGDAFTIKVVEGNHTTALVPALDIFTAIIVADAKGVRP